MAEDGVCSNNELSIYSLGVFHQHTVSPQIDLLSRSHSNLDEICKRQDGNISSSAR